MASGRGEGKARRSYRPAVELLEALRLLSDATQTLPGIAVECDLLGLSAPSAPPISDATWDAALVQNELADFLDSTQRGQRMSRSRPGSRNWIAT